MLQYVWLRGTSCLSSTVQQPKQGEKRAKLFRQQPNNKIYGGRMIKKNNYCSANVFVLRAQQGLSLQTSDTLCVELLNLWHNTVMTGMHVPGCRLGLQLGLIKTEIVYCVLSMTLPVGVQTEYGVIRSNPDFLAWESCYVSGFSTDRRFFTEG